MVNSITGLVTCFNFSQLGGEGLKPPSNDYVLVKSQPQLADIASWFGVNVMPALLPLIARDVILASSKIKNFSGKAVKLYVPDYKDAILE